MSRKQNKNMTVTSIWQGPKKSPSLSRYDCPRPESCAYLHLLTSSIFYFSPNLPVISHSTVLLEGRNFSSGNCVAQPCLCPPALQHAPQNWDAPWEAHASRGPDLPTGTQGSAAGSAAAQPLTATAIETSQGTSVQEAHISDSSRCMSTSTEKISQQRLAQQSAHILLPHTVRPDKCIFNYIEQPQLMKSVRF